MRNEGSAISGGAEVPRLSKVDNELSVSHVAGSVVQAGSVGAVHFHAASAAPGVIPRQLPALPVCFVNRARELDVLGRLLADEEGQHIAVLAGLGGVGKTGLGVHWARHAGDRFEGGQLYADMASLRHRGGVEVSDVLGGFLRALGVREESIPAELTERAALFRSVTATRRTLVLLDNVDQPAQVTPLIPGAAGSVVIVTSHRRLGGLLVQGATLLPLEPLDSGDGVRLLERMLGVERVRAERDAAVELAGLCGGLPIALRVCGARLLRRRRLTIGRLVEELTDERRRLARLTTEGEPIVEAVFDIAYRALPEEAARLYRRLGSHPGPDFSIEAIAAAADLPRDQVEDLTERLLEASMIEEVTADRYRFHDLVRLHARRHAGDDQITAKRIVGWYLGRAKWADHVVMGRRLRLADPPPAGPSRSDVGGAEASGPGEHGFGGPAEALEWLETERINLLAAMRAAMSNEWYEVAWQFGEALWALYGNRKHHADELEVSELGVEAARRCGNLAAEARMRNHTARALLALGDLDGAGEQLASALEAARFSGHRRVESTVIESVGLVHLEKGDHMAAIDAFRRSRRINAELGNPRGVALQGYHLGLALNDARRHDEAIDELRHAMTIVTDIDDELSQGKIALQLGEAYGARGRRTEAVTELLKALAIMRERRMPLREIQALDLLAQVTDDVHSAERYRRQANELRAALGRPNA